MFSDILRSNREYIGDLTLIRLKTSNPIYAVGRVFEFVSISISITPHKLTDHRSEASRKNRVKQRQGQSKHRGCSCVGAAGPRGGCGVGHDSAAAAVAAAAAAAAAGGGKRRCGGGDGRGSGGGRPLGDPDVHLLAGATVAGNAADEEVVAPALQRDGVIAGGVGGDGRRRVARLVVRLAHLQHVVEVLVVLEHCHIIMLKANFLLGSFTETSRGIYTYISYKE